jgi:peptide/nickel transport system substrate-binding protein
MKKSALLLAPLSLCLALTLLCHSQAFAAGKKDSLVIALGSEVDTLNPIVGTTFSDGLIKDAALRYPIVLDEENKEHPMWIKEIPTVANHKVTITKTATGKTMKVELEFKEEVSWADGVPLTCEDLKATWIIGSNPNVSVGSRETYTDITAVNVDAKNPKKCSVEFKKASWQWYLGLPYIMPAHIEMPVFEKFKDKPQGYERNSIYTTAPSTPGLWCGPYRVTDYKNGSHISLVANEKWKGTQPKIKNMTFKFILNSASLESNLLSGAVDMIAPSTFTLDQAFAFDKKVKSQKLPYTVHLKPNATFNFWDVNLSHPVLKDPRVRKALFMAINRDEINKAFYEGRLIPVNSFANPADSFYTNDPKLITIYPFDKKKAGELLDQAGWKMSPDGFRYKDGKKLSFSVKASVEAKIIELVEVYVKNNWKQIGVDLAIKNVPGRILFSEVVPKRDFDFAFYSMVGGVDDDHRTMFHSSFIPNEKNSYSGQNSSGWSNPNVDKWLDEEEVEFDAKKRIEQMRKVMKAYSDELPTLPLFYRLGNAVTPINLKGYKMAPSLFTEFNKAEEWYFE